jgi:MFS family permease
VTSTSKEPLNVVSVAVSVGVPADTATPPSDAAPPAVQTSARASQHHGTFAALRQPSFGLFLLGATLSNAGQWIQQVTLGWLVYDLTGSGTALGTVNLVRSSAGVVMAPVAGIVTDRVNRRLLMLGSSLWLFTITFTLALLLSFGWIEVWYLFVFAALAGAAQTFDRPIRQVATFDLVPRAVAPNAVALLQTGWSVTRLLAPALGGVLLLWFGPAGNFFVQAAAYVLIAVSIIWIRFPSRPVSSRRHGAARRGLGAGLAYAFHEPTTRTFLLMGWVLPLFIIPTFSALPPIYAKDVFHGGPETLGLLMASVGLGGIAGGVFAASLGSFERRGLVQLSSLAGTGLALIAFALSPTLWLALPMLSLAGAFETVFITTNQTLLQLSVPDDMRGQVSSVVSLNVAIGPIGAIFAGTGADLVGPHTITVVLSAIAVAITLAAYPRSKTIREYRLSQALAAASTRERARDA